jgi:hexosaminidase
MHRSIKSLVIGTAILATSAPAEVPAFVPLPARVEARDGRYRLGETTTIVAPATLNPEAKLLAERLQRGAGLAAPVVGSGSGIVLSIDPQLPAEGYELIIRTDGVAIRGGTNAGVFYGIQTFLQALPAAIYGSEPTPNTDWSAPALTVRDAPATPWRGLHLDSARHFQPKEFIFKFIDAMAAQKLNRFHWHLVDSEGWRLEIKKYPKLTQVAEGTPDSYPGEIPTNPTLRAKYRYGYFHGPRFHTQEDIREIVGYAASRHVTIIPEIEFPAHAMIVLTAYPEFSTTGKPPVARSNISPDLIGVHPEALGFLRDVLDETMALFPGKWIHFGGDEAPKGQWKNDPYAQKRIDELGLRVPGSGNSHASEDALQAWVFNEMSAHVAKQARVAVGWEEIMHGENIKHLAKGSVVMPWLSGDNAVKSANAGFGVVHTAVSLFYLDSLQSTDPREPQALYQRVSSPEAIQRFELFPARLTAQGRKHILGAQGQLWTELMPRTDDVEYQAYPRACAIAELTWTPFDLRGDSREFMARLHAHGERLSALGLNHRQITPPAGLTWSPAFLQSGSNWIVPVPAAATSARSLEVRFDYKSGTHGLEITAVELLADGQATAEDRHAGFTGGNPKNAVYQLSIPPSAKPPLSLRITAKGAGGNDSHGEISIIPKR